MQFLVLRRCADSCETSLHYVPLRTLVVLFDQNNFSLNKTGLHMVDMC